MSTTARPTFLAWLLEQDQRDDPIGDLARDVAADPLAPTTDQSPVALYDSLTHRADRGALDACTAAWREWEVG